MNNNLFYSLLEARLWAMKPHQKLYKLIKTVLLARGNWKEAPRGRAFKKGEDPNRWIPPSRVTAQRKSKRPARGLSDKGGPEQEG